MNERRLSIRMGWPVFFFLILGVCFAAPAVAENTLSSLQEQLSRPLDIEEMTQDDLSLALVDTRRLLVEVRQMRTHAQREWESEVPRMAEIRMEMRMLEQQLAVLNRELRALQAERSRGDDWAAVEHQLVLQLSKLTEALTEQEEP